MIHVEVHIESYCNGVGAERPHPPSLSLIHSSLLLEIYEAVCQLLNVNNGTFQRHKAL